MKFFLYLASYLVIIAMSQSAFAADDTKPYTGQASDRSLAATDNARRMLLKDKAAMKNWTLEEWQSWADARFTAATSPDGTTTWRDWLRGRVKLKSDDSIVSMPLNGPATKWSADDWRTFVDYIDTDYTTQDKYFAVILPDDRLQHKGTFLLGRWAYSMYEDSLPERQTWEKEQGESGESSDMSVSVERLVQISQAQLEMLCFLSGLITATIVALTWKW